MSRFVGMHGLLPIVIAPPGRQPCKQSGRSTTGSVICADVLVLALGPPLGTP